MNYKGNPIKSHKHQLFQLNIGGSNHISGTKSIYTSVLSILQFTHFLITKPILRSLHLHFWDADTHFE